MIRTRNIMKHERGLLFKDRDFQGVLAPGRHWFFDPLLKLRIDVLSVRDPWIRHSELDVIVKSGALIGEALVADIKDNQRALVWIDGRFDSVLKPGLYALWTVFRDVRVDIFDARTVRFEHEKLPVILAGKNANDTLQVFNVEPGYVGLFFKDGQYQETLRAGTHAFWKGVNRVQINHIDLREQTIDVAGQEIITADKVTLRLNALLTYRITDPLKSVTEVDDCKQALYREAQLALRAVIGSRELDALLTEKDAVAKELEEIVKARATAFGIEVLALGIRDVILPGEMKELMNKVTEAKKAGEAALITRREETAAMRMQANTAKILESSPTLMRIRELEVLEKVAATTNLKVVLGEKGLTERIAKLI